MYGSGSSCDGNRNDKKYLTTQCTLTLKVLNFWKFTSYCSLKPLWLGIGEVVPARTSPTLHPPSPPTLHQLSQLALEELPWFMPESVKFVFQPQPCDFDGTETSRPPSAFQKPHARFATGHAQVMSQHNIAYQPPMPKPPLFSTWWSDTRSKHQ